MRARREHIHPKRIVWTLQRLCLSAFILCMLVAFIPASCIAQETETEAEEILVSINIQGMGMIEVPAIINEQDLHLPVVDIFDYLKIKNDPTQSFDTIKGFFINQENTFVIDRINNSIWFRDTETKLNKGDLVKTETALYLKREYFDSIFGLPSAFNFRALLVNMNSKNELPVMREARLEAIRLNLRRLKGDFSADTTFKRLNPWIHFGMTDWSVIAAQQSEGQTDTRLNLGLGGIMLGGEVNASLNYSTSMPFKEKQQFYMWRYVENEARAVKQVAVGKIPIPTISSIFSPVLGVTVTNTPTIAKRAFGSYRLSNITEPGWIVELYVNNTLVDYVKADESGFFSFNVPLVYGNSSVKLRYYGPFGEERVKEENVSIPFSFMSPGKFEYTATAGIVEDDSLTRLARGGIIYGLNRYITLSSGVEYLSSVKANPVMPYAATSLRLSSGLLFFGEYNYKVRAKTGLFYRTVSNWQFELNYTRYEKGQKAININALEERRAVVSVPARFRKFSLFSMLTFNQTILPSTSYTTTEWLVSGTYRRVDTRLNTIGIFMEATTLVYTNFAMAFRLPRSFVFTPEAQYQYTLNEFISIKASLEKRVLRRGYVGLIFEENFKSNFRNIGLQLRYDFSFGQAGFTGRYFNNKFSFLEAVRGSVMYDKETNYAGFNNSTSIGRSGIVLLPYLDMNCNNQRDEGESKVSGLKFRINSGRVLPESKDSTIRVQGLEPYNSYFIELNRLSFDNIAWQMQKRTLKVFAEPNMFRLIEVPISVVGEVTGTVNLLKGGIEQGQGQILVNIYSGDSLVAKTLSEPDGYFSYIGLPPGEYVATIDTAQLKKINMTASVSQPFTIAVTKEGDVVEGLQFTLRSLFDTAQVEQASNNIPDTVNKQIVKSAKKSKKTVKVNAGARTTQAANSIKKRAPIPGQARPVKTTPKGGNRAGTPASKAGKPGATPSKAAKQAQAKPKPALKPVKPVTPKKPPVRADSSKPVEKKVIVQTDTVSHSPIRQRSSVDSTKLLNDSLEIISPVLEDSISVKPDSLKVDGEKTGAKKNFLKNLRRLFGPNK